jgi:hypothetical protein
LPEAGVILEMGIELHSRSCNCRGGSWAVVGGASSARCKPGDGAATASLSVEEWRALGKPATVEDYRETVERAARGERREFRRYHAVLPVRVSRLPTWKSSTHETEETTTEVIARGGCMVRSRLAVQSGETLSVAFGKQYESRAEVGYVVPAIEGDDRFLRVGLRFLDAPFPDELIPADAEPL